MVSDSAFKFVHSEKCDIKSRPADDRRSVVLSRSSEESDESAKFNLW